VAEPGRSFGAQGKAGDGDYRHLLDPSAEDLHRGGLGELSFCAPPSIRRRRYSARSGLDVKTYTTVTQIGVL